MEDNRIFAKGMAEHYAQFPNMVAYQIYNEPHYPVYEMFDYNEDTIQQYRRWLVEKQVMTAEEAKDYQPPKGRKEQSPRMWALWRLFARDGITAFLNNAANASYEAVPLPTYTCFTVAAVTKRNAYHGCDLFANSRSMQLVGYTTYVHAFGANEAMLSLQTDTAQCAAELGGTESWCIELDSRTYIPPSIYTRGVYTVLGSGCKGIVFYQWRGDYPAPGVPFPNSCGLLNYDGTKTENFENGAKVNRFIQQHNDLLVNAHRVHEGVGMLHSDYATFMCDAMENGDKTRADEEYYNRHLSLFAKTYRELRETGISVSIVDEQGLRENPFNIKVLLLPSLALLSPEEQQAMQEFRQKGGKVYYMEGTEQGTGEFGYRELEDQERGYVEKVFWPIHTPRDVLDAEGICPKVTSQEPRVSVRLLEGEDYALVVLTNAAVCVKETTVRLTVQIPFKTATFSDIDGEKEVLIDGNMLTIQNLTDGGILILR
ncbi:MAG: beta-galactosidase [Clostridia bacterium]|nr:beta-galactosidase [Clostridia bacterium]